MMPTYDMLYCCHIHLRRHAHFRGTSSFAFGMKDRARDGLGDCCSQAAAEITEPSAEVQEAPLRRVMLLTDVADVGGCRWLLRV